MRPDGQMKHPEEQAGGDGGTNQIRVLLADSQAIYRVGMRKIFALEDDIRVVAQAETFSPRFSAFPPTSFFSKGS